MRVHDKVKIPSSPIATNCCVFDYLYTSSLTVNIVFHKKNCNLATECLAELIFDVHLPHDDSMQEFDKLKYQSKSLNRARLENAT